VNELFLYDFRHQKFGRITLDKVANYVWVWTWFAEQRT
jgi:hypothetical protein